MEVTNNSLTPAFTVIIPVYNSGQTLDACLRALKNQNNALPFEVIVVDDASTDNSMAIAFQHDVKVLQMKKNSGPGAARNHGVAHAPEGVIVFVGYIRIPQPMKCVM